MFVRIARACMCASVIGASALAVAEPAGNIDINVFRPAMDSSHRLTRKVGPAGDALDDVRKTAATRASAR